MPLHLTRHTGQPEPDWAKRIEEVSRNLDRVFRSIALSVTEHEQETQPCPVDGPEGFTQRDEANALAWYAFRDGFLEDLHHGPAGFSDGEMRRLMVESSAKLADLLYIRRTAPELYQAFLIACRFDRCRAWSRTDRSASLEWVYRAECPSCGKGVRTCWAFCASCGTRLPEGMEVPPERRASSVVDVTEQAGERQAA